MAFVAVTVKVDDIPEVIDTWLTVMATVGVGGLLIRLPLTHPVKSNGSNRPGAIKERTWRIDGRMNAFVKTFSFVTLSGPLVESRRLLRYGNSMPQFIG